MFCHCKIVDWVIICTSYIQFTYANDKTDTQKCAPYLDIHLEIDNGGRLEAKRQT